MPARGRLFGPAAALGLILALAPVTVSVDLSGMSLHQPTVLAQAGTPGEDKGGDRGGNGQGNGGNANANADRGSYHCRGENGTGGNVRRTPGGRRDHDPGMTGAGFNMEIYDSTAKGERPYEYNCSV